jgi:type I restriction-modification system DNA methylase subunit
MARKTSPGSNGQSANLGFEAKLWLTADKLRNNMDAAEYSRAERDRLPKAARRADAGTSVNHVVLGIIFLKYISDSFEEHHAKLKAGKGDYTGANPDDPDEYRAEDSKQNFRPIPMVLPPKELMAAFIAQVAPLYAQITASLHQSRTLATLRDTLLPKLLSGEIQMGAFENLVAGGECPR